jgi:hypothetical protein
VSDDGYHSPVTPGGLIGCVVTVPFYFFALMLFENAIHSSMPWWHWLLFCAGLVAVPAAILAAVKWIVDRLIAILS